MKKIIIAAIAAMCFAGSSFAALDDEYMTLGKWLSQYYCEQNGVPYLDPSDPNYDIEKQKGGGMFALPALTLWDDMRAKIKQEFPMDPRMEAALKAIDDQRGAAYLAIAKRYGYSSYDELYKNIKSDPALQNAKIEEQIRKIDSDYYNERGAVGSAYWTEFETRYKAAVIEAIKRIKDNAKAMNPNAPK